MPLMRPQHLRRGTTFLHIQHFKQTHGYPKLGFETAVFSEGGQQKYWPQSSFVQNVAKHDKWIPNSSLWRLFETIPCALSLVGILLQCLGLEEFFRGPVWKLTMNQIWMYLSTFVIRDQQSSAVGCMIVSCFRIEWCKLLKSNTVGNFN